MLRFCLEIIENISAPINAKETQIITQSVISDF